MNQKDLNDGGYIKPLTGIRAIAAFMVYMVHYNPFPKESFLYSFFAQFYTGVSLFFVLSGFLITHRYHDRFNLGKSWIFDYIRNRVARIYPVYFLLTTITAVYFLVGDLSKPGPYTHRQIILNNGWIYFTNITFIRGYFHDLVFSLIPQGWSLSVEEFFYFSAPITWLLLKRKFNLGYQALCLFAAGLLLVWVGGHVHFYAFMDSIFFMLKFTYFGKAVQFFAGVWLALLIHKRGGKLTPRINITYTGLALTIGCILCMAFAWRHQHNYLTACIDNFLLSFAIALFFGGLIVEKSPIASFLATPVMDLLGKSSYAFYLIHVGICQQLLDSYITHNYLVQFILLNFLAIAVYKWIEHPLMLRIRRRKPTLAPIEVPVANESYVN